MIALDGGTKKDCSKSRCQLLLRDMYVPKMNSLKLKKHDSALFWTKNNCLNSGTKNGCAKSRYQ